jgi:hypothetical protein
MTEATIEQLPIILVRGFGGLGVSDERRIAYQGFNDGTVYPGKRGENYIYEGMVLKFLKSDYTYYDATNVVGYYERQIQQDPSLAEELVGRGFSREFFEGNVVIDPAMALALLRRPPEEIRRTLWVYRYYDLPRHFREYADGLIRLIEFIQALARKEGENPPPRVNVIAHSMGGLVVREALQVAYPERYGSAKAAENHINKIVTLGTPHKGISFQLLSNWIGVEADGELERFNPKNQEDSPWSYLKLADHFDPRRILTVVGTNYRAYGSRIASGLNRIFAVGGEFGPLYNRSDGLVKQDYAQLPGAPRTFIDKCHGGEDSLVTSREAYEIATRFFFGDVHVRLRMVRGRVKHGKDPIGGSEFFFGVSIKARDVDFELFHQSREAENCYGPYRSDRLDDAKVAFPPLARHVIWEGWVDRSRIKPNVPDLVFRLQMYVSERDSFGIRFSDDVILNRQLFVRVMPPEGMTLMDGIGNLSVHSNSRLTDDPALQSIRTDDGTWEFSVNYADFEATFAVELETLDAPGQ